VGQRNPDIAQINERDSEARKVGSGPVSIWLTTEKLLELTNLKSAFELCSGREMLALLCRAINETESVGFKTVVQDANRIGETSGEPLRAG
jgi:hypothetical protein